MNNTKPEIETEIARLKMRNNTRQEIETQMIARLKLRTEIQRIVRSSTAALESVEKELAELVTQLKQISKP